MKTIDLSRFDGGRPIFNFAVDKEFEMIQQWQGGQSHLPTGCETGDAHDRHEYSSAQVYDHLLAVTFCRSLASAPSWGILHCR